VADRKEWILGGILIVVLVVATISQVPSGYGYPLVPRLSTNFPSPDGAKALYLTLRKLGVEVGRRQAPLADAGPLPPALAILAPGDPLTPGEISAVLDRVRSGGRLLWVAAVPWSPMADSLHLRWKGSESPHPMQMSYGRFAGVVARHPWTEGVDSVRGFRFGWVGRSVHREGVTPLVTANDSVVLAFVETLGAGRIVAFADRAPVENRGIRDSGAAPILVRAAAALAGDDTLVFDEFHHGFRGGSVIRGVAGFLTHRKTGHVVAQLALVGLLALLGAAVRFGAPSSANPEQRRSPVEHVEALARVYQEAGAVRKPRLFLVGGLARSLGDPLPRSNVEAASLLGRVAVRGTDVAEPARWLREALERDTADMGQVSTMVDRIRDALVLRGPARQRREARTEAKEKRT
jgi:hypothetical protein